MTNTLAKYQVNWSYPCITPYFNTPSILNRWDALVFGLSQNIWKFPKMKAFIYLNIWLLNWNHPPPPPYMHPFIFNKSQLFQIHFASLNSSENYTNNRRKIQVHLSTHVCTNTQTWRRIYIPLLGRQYSICKRIFFPSPKSYGCNNENNQSERKISPLQPMIAATFHLGLYTSKIDPSARS